jgi:predicted branched-subunit amino acid permease
MRDFRRYAVGAGATRLAGRLPSDGPVRNSRGYVRGYVMRDGVPEMTVGPHSIFTTSPADLQAPLQRVLNPGAMAYSNFPASTGTTVRAVTADATTPTAADRWRHLLAGAGAMMPWLLGLVPYGLVIGISAAQADVPTVAGWLTGPLIFAGSAQVATIQLLDSGAAPLVVIAAALAVNLRLVLYSATMARHWRGTSRRWQAIAAYAVVDPSVVVGIGGYERAARPSDGHLYYLGGAATLWIAWQAAITVGATVGAVFPHGLHLELVIPLFLVGEVARRLTNRATKVAVLAAVVLAIVGRSVPVHLGTLVAIAGGIAAALFTRESDR